MVEVDITRKNCVTVVKPTYKKYKRKAYGKQALTES